MKGKEFGELLGHLADFLRGLKAHEPASVLDAIASVFASASSRSVSEICNVLRGVRPVEDGNDSRLREMLRLLPLLRRFLLAAKSSKATLDDLDKLASALDAHKQSSATVVAHVTVNQLRKLDTVGKPSPRDDVVASYATRLEDALSDELRFAEVFRELKIDSAISPMDARKLAKIFAKEPAKSKEQALKLIWGRHSALMGSRARQKANKGRTAA